MVNVGKYTIHGCYGYVTATFDPYMIYLLTFTISGP